MPTRARKSPLPASLPPPSPITAPIAVALSALVQTELNARRVNAAHGIDELAESIRTHGLLSCLDVVPSADLSGTYEVVGGGRRLRALERLASQGHLSPDAEIPVVLGDRADGRAISLEENIRRIEMNAADELEAYRKIVDELAAAGDADPIGSCARRFQKTRGHVEGRLRLARLAPAILEALRSEAIGLDSAKAYAGFDDQVLQLSVFSGEEGRTFGQRHAPAQIRDAMRMRTYPAGGMVAAYVGLDAYVAAGGRTDRDMFFGADQGERMLDPSLIHKLAQDKALAELPACVARDGFAGGVLTQGFNEAPAWPKVPPGYGRSPVGAKPEDLLESDRKSATAIYTLARDGSGLIAIGYVTLIPLPVAPAVDARRPDAPPRPAPDFAHLDRAIGQIDGSIDAERAARARARRVRYAAAHIAVRRSIGTMLKGRASWPADESYVAAVTEADDETLLVAVQIRVPRAEWEAALPDAEAQLDGEAA